ncbi:hypothetical protein NW768_001772 [Fusarium equiseti]|uniref:Mating type protein 1-2-9 n=1 Tax=Fusarium equiseti TaxID=61235 RepID=A0ABQ8RRH9_FUSEQ|nr:hypothetical protein NW768_001772 [Fusarium equiseti]
MPTRATEEDVQAILKGPALNHLAPVPGGKWRVLSRTMNAIEVAYVVNHTQILAITVQLGANPALVTDQCWQHVYGYPTASLVDGALQEWEPPVSNVGNRAEEMESLTQMYNQVLDANSIMATGTIVRQTDTSPTSLNVPLSEPDHFPTSTVNHEQPYSQAQIHVPVVAQVGSFQQTQATNISGHDTGVVPAFQDMADSMHATLPFISHDGHVNGSDDNPRWDSFNQDT